MEKDFEKNIKRPEQPADVVGILFCKKCNSKKTLRDIKIEKKDDKSIFKCKKCGMVSRKKKYSLNKYLYYT